MKKPDFYDIKEFLCRGKIKSIDVNYVQTGNESCETRISVKLLSGDDKTFTCKKFLNFIEIKFDWNSIGVIREIYKKEVDEWKSYEKNNQLEIAEYKRLKAKYGDVL